MLVSEVWQERQRAQMLKVSHNFLAAGLKPLPPLHQSAFDFKRVSGGASSQPSWQSLAPLDGNAGPQMILPADMYSC